MMLSIYSCSGCSFASRGFRCENGRAASTAKRTLETKNKAATLHPTSIEVSEPESWFSWRNNFKEYIIKHNYKNDQYDVINLFRIVSVPAVQRTKHQVTFFAPG